jgi:hypothetical protein
MPVEGSCWPFTGDASHPLYGHVIAGLGSEAGFFSVGLDLR